MKLKDNNANLPHSIITPEMEKVEEELEKKRAEEEERHRKEIEASLNGNMLAL
jgi:hypothetical protein